MMLKRFSCASVLLLSAALAFAEGPTTQPTQPAKPIPADQMLSQMLKPAPQTGKPLSTAGEPAAIDKSTGAGALAPNAPKQTVLREGSYITERTGRLARSADGQQEEFVFDSDGKAMKDPPIIVLPNLKLMAMENAVKGSTRDLRFRISGLVTEYNGRNYVLLEMVVVLPDSLQQF